MTPWLHTILRVAEETERKIASILLTGTLFTKLRFIKVGLLVI